MEHLFSLNFLKKLKRQMSHREIKSLPEQIAFNLIMAIVPLLVIIVQLGTYFSLNTDLAKYLITAYAPQEVQKLLLYLFNNSLAPQTGTLFIIITAISFFWIISKGLYGISSASNTTYQVPLMKFAFLERIFSFIMLCFMVLLLLIAIILALFGQSIISMVIHLLNIHVESYLLLIFNILRSIISFIAYLSFFLLLFYLTPTIKIKIHEIIPGALIAAIGWSIASIGFSFYANYIANYSKFYGGLSVIIILLFWLYILGYAITIGLQVNYILKRDYYGGVEYLPRLLFIQKSKFLSRWTKFSVNDEENIE
ncbi:MAG: YihY/virulence factor BrkB family protein [Turicibacter sp.]|nr:YihY/virulence factor BrkB family protein [Turicibacter sp.]